MKKVIVLLRTAPYGLASGGEAFRLIIGLAGMGMDTTAVLVDDGVYCGIKDQKAESIEMKPLDQAYGQLSEFGAKLFIHKESIEERGISHDRIIKAEFITTRDLANLVVKSDTVISF